MLPSILRDGRRAAACATVLLCTSVVSAQSNDLSKMSTEELRALLQRNLDETQALREQVDALAAEAELARRLPVEPVQRGETQQVFPNRNNPSVGVFIDFVADAGNAEEKIGEGDRASDREIEVDLRAPIAPFADGVLILAFEDIGGSEYETHVEEAYARIALDALLGGQTPGEMLVGRFRLPFGRNNRLHTHDLPQVDRAVPLAYQFGEEGLGGDGVMVQTPVHRTEGGGVTSLEAALVIGENMTGEESLLGEAAEDAGLELDSDGLLASARLSHFRPLGDLSDIEFGASVLRGVTDDAVTTDVDTEIRPKAQGVDVTLRTRDDETGQGSWLFQAEVIRTNFDYGAPAAPGFPVGNDSTRGWTVMAQRQTGPASYVGVRAGAADMLASAESVIEQSAYWTFYPDEFFRVRVQAQHFSVDDGGARESVWRGLLQLTFNFGAHLPHPYWVNR